MCVSYVQFVVCLVSNSMVSLAVGTEFVYSVAEVHIACHFLARRSHGSHSSLPSLGGRYVPDIALKTGDWICIANSSNIETC